MKTADLRILGLARRAGYIAAGEDAVILSIMGKSARLALLSNDLGQTARKKIIAAAGRCNIPCLTISADMAELGYAIGRGKTGAAAVEDIGLAASFAESMRGEGEEFEKTADALSEKAKRLKKRKKETQQKRADIKTGKRRTK